MAAHRMLGVAHLFERQNDLAAQEFRKLLQLRPDFRMEPLIDPPLVVDFFNGVLRQYEAELGDLARLRQQAEADERRRQDAVRNGPTVIERRFVRNSLMVAFLPFGAGQFQNGQRTKGWVFLGSRGGPGRRLGGRLHHELRRLRLPPGDRVRAGRRTRPLAAPAARPGSDPPRPRTARSCCSRSSC